MENDMKLGIFLLCVIGLICIGNSFAIMKIESGISQDDLQKEIAKIPQVEMPEIVIPTAEEIASKIEVPMPGELDNSKISDLWEDLYDEEIEILLSHAEEDSLIEIEDDNYELLEDYLKSLFEGFDEIEDVDVEEVDCEVKILGLEEDEDKVAVCEYELEVEYSLKEGMSVDYKKDILVTAEVSYEEGDFDEEKVNLIFA